MKDSGGRYVLEKNFDEVMESVELLEEESETHYIFGLNGIFSFDENGSIFSIVVTDDETQVLHQFQRKNSMEKKRTDINKEKAVDFLSETGYEPFMRLDIKRYLCSDSDKEFAIEEVEQLGEFTDCSDIGGEEVCYAEELKKDMVSDSERKEEITDQAKRIIRNVKG